MKRQWIQISLMEVFLGIVWGMLWGCQGVPSSPKESEPGTAKSKSGLAIVSDIRSETPGAKLWLQGKTEKRQVKKGEAVQLGEQIQTGKGIQAEIRFDKSTFLLLQENSAVTIQGSPLVSNLQGSIAVSRQIGSPTPFVMKIGNEEISVIHGKTLVDALGDTATIEVQSGELLRLGANTYMGAGDRFEIGSPQKTKKTPATAMVPPHWSPSIVPVESDAALQITPTVQRGIGTLVARNPRTNKTAQNAMKMNDHRVNVQIQEGVAITRVEEAFTNMSKATVEAAYRFLIPAGAQITRLALDVNGRIEEGEVLEKKRAARIFKQIVDDSVRPKDPALLEWEQGATFKMKIFPIKPGETRRVYLTYTTPLTSSSGYYKYVYPLANAKGAADVDTFSIAAAIETEHPIRKVRTPLFSAKTDQKEKSAVVTYSTQHQTPQNDFVLTFETDHNRSGLRSLVQTEKNGVSFGMFLWKPESVNAAAAPASTSAANTVVALVDVSYGTSEEMIELSAATLVEMIGGLGHSDRFNVLACDASCRPIFEKFKAPSAANVIQLYEKVRRIKPGGASNLLGNFQQAFAMAAPYQNATVVYVGDGIATAGELEPAKLIGLLSQTKPQNVRAHTVGIGPDIDAPVLRRLAAALNGANYNLSLGESPGSASWQLARLFTQDGLSNVSIRATGADGQRLPLIPNKVGFVPSGKELLFTARLDGLRPSASQPATIEIEGTRINGTPYKRSYAVTLQTAPPAPGFVSRLWAAAHIEALEFGEMNGADSAKEIVQISRQYRIASRHTSWIVLENQRMYDLFKVQRTDAEEYHGAEAQFAEATDVEDDEDMQVDKMEKLSVAGDSGAALSDLPAMRAPARAKSGAASPSRVLQPKKKAMTSRGAEPLSLSSDNLGSEFSSAFGGRSARPPKRTPRCQGPTYKITVAAARPDSAAAIEKASTLKRQLDSKPLSRSLHRRYVRQLAKMSNRQIAFEAANKWRTVDPHSTNALLAYASETARSGDRETAARLFGAVSEVRKTDVKNHRRLAEMYNALGDHAAAAGHYKSLWTLSKKRNAEDVVDYFFALALSGQRQLFQVESQTVFAAPEYSKIYSQVTALQQSLSNGIVPSRMAVVSKGVLAVRVEASSDVDVVLIDPYGRVSSGLWRFGADVADFTSADGEKFWAHGLFPGQYKVAVVRPDSASLEAITGTVRIQPRGKQIQGEPKSIPFRLEGASQMVAQVMYDQLAAKRCYQMYR